MLRRFASLTALLAFLLAFPAGAADDKDSKKTDSTKPAADVKQGFNKMMTSGELTGKLTQWGEGSSRSMTLDVTLKYEVPNEGAIRALYDLSRQASDAARDTNPANRARRLAEIQVEMAKQQRNRFTVKEEHKKIELQAGDDMKVRTSQPPVKLDDKGAPAKYSAKELKELKGPDPKVPGYTAAPDALQKDQYVTVYLAKKKKSAPKDKDEKLTDDKPVVTMVVILAEPPAK